MNAGTDDSGTDAVISVVIAARNAGETLAETLESLLAQTRAAWRAIIVDDGSTDSTRIIAENYAAQDTRFSVIDGPQLGTAAAARNAGLAHTTGEWILFLDSDDLLDVDMMQRMMARLAETPDADAVHCGARHIESNGRQISQIRCEHLGPDLFPVFARYCAFAIHCCIFRRRLLDAAGRFDESLPTCEDFDLWQRFARLGARFVALDAILVTYRLRTNLTWFDAEPFLSNCLEVIRRGHAADPRLLDSAVPLEHRQGADPLQCPSAEYNIVVLSAGHQIARGRSAKACLHHLPRKGYPLAEGAQTAQTLMNAIPLALCRPQSAWEELWPLLERRLWAFLKALEKRTGAVGLANRTMLSLETLVVSQISPSLFENDAVRMFGKTAAMGIDITRGIDNIEIRGADRLTCVILSDGRLLGTLTLPVFDGRMHAAVLKDAIAARFAWPILESFFLARVYPGLTVGNDGNRWVVRRGDIVLASGLGANPVEDGSLHNLVGWAIFIQELCGISDQALGALCDPSISPPDGPTRAIAGNELSTIELSEPIPTLTGIVGEEIDVEITVGGSPVFLTHVPVEKGVVCSGVLRAAAFERGKMELARVAVREAITGYSGDVALPMVERLRKAARGWMRDVATDAVARNCLVFGSVRSGEWAEDMRRAALPATLAGAIMADLIPVQPLFYRSRRPRACIYMPELMARDTWPAPPGDPTLLDRLFGRSPLDSRDPAMPEVWSLRGAVKQAPVQDDEVRPHAERDQTSTDRLPILMYHAIGDAGPEALSRWRVATAMFEAHMRYLKDEGFCPTTLDEWRSAREAGRPLPGRRVLITFDDAYVDFEQNALPILRKYGFPANLYVPSGRVGKTADWDSWTGSPLPLLDWDGLKRVRDAGIEIGSHSISHPHLTGLSPTEMVEELWNSRALLSQTLGVVVDSIAYPSGSHDEIVEHLAAACGYRHALTTRDELSAMTDHHFSLARIEVRGEQPLEAFIARVSS